MIDLDITEIDVVNLAIAHGYVNDFTGSNKEHRRKHRKAIKALINAGVLSEKVLSRTRLLADRYMLMPDWESRITYPSLAMLNTNIRSMVIDDIADLVINYYSEIIEYNCNNMVSQVSELDYEGLVEARRGGYYILLETLIETYSNDLGLLLQILNRNINKEREVLSYE